MRIFVSATTTLHVLRLDIPKYKLARCHYIGRTTPPPEYVFIFVRRSQLVDLVLREVLAVQFSMIFAATKPTWCALLIWLARVFPLLVTISREACWHYIASSAERSLLVT